MARDFGFCLGGGGGGGPPSVDPLLCPFPFSFPCTDGGKNTRVRARTLPCRLIPSSVHSEGGGGGMTGWVVRDIKKNQKESRESEHTEKMTRARKKRPNSERMYTGNATI